ncbi:MAG: hypothetical protein U0M23_06410 [Acutalibacteraceae bacterium]|nr:hypothetical protein [Acutalibacteraceae bacterium]
MKKLFSIPELEIVRFTQVEDILSTSTEPKDPDDIINTPVDDLFG